MFETTEVRWFQKSTTWPNVEAWFKKGPMDATIEPFRLDYYLSMPLEEELGIKVRDGKLEIKRWVHDDGVHSFSDRVSGHMSTWRKWSFPLVNSEELLESTKEPWIKIGKDRRVRKFRAVETTRLKKLIPVMRPRGLGASPSISHVRKFLESPEVLWDLCPRYSRLSNNDMIAMCDPFGVQVRIVRRETDRESRGIGQGQVRHATIALVA
jgi:hypothetical protein